MAASGATHYRWDDIPKEQLKPDLHRRLIAAERMTIGHVYLDKGCVVPLHSHENEQLTYILEGTLRFWLGDDDAEVAEREVMEGRHGLRDAATIRVTVEQMILDLLELPAFLGRGGDCCA